MIFFFYWNIELYYIYIYIYIYIISIEHVTIFLNKYISKGAVDMKFSPDVGNTQTHTYKENKTNKCWN